MTDHRTNAASSNLRRAILSDFYSAPLAGALCVCVSVGCCTVSRLICRQPCECDPSVPADPTHPDFCISDTYACCRFCILWSFALFADPIRQTTHGDESATRGMHRLQLPRHRPRSAVANGPFYHYGMDCFPRQLTTSSMTSSPPSTQYTHSAMVNGPFCHYGMGHLPLEYTTHTHTHLPQ